MNAPIPLNAAERRARQQRRDDEPTPPDAEDPIICPITPLGHVDGKFYFLNIEGEKRCLSARQMGSRPELTSLFLGDMTWLLRSFKAVDAEGNPKGFNINKAVEYLMDASRRAGMYGDHIITRRPGVWLGDNGNVIAHCGDALFIEGEKFPAGVKMAGQIFTAAAREAYPAARAAGPDTAQNIGNDMRLLWNFRDANADIIALGLVAQSYLAAALSWRANGFISGGSNAGKSKLLELLRAMVPMHFYSTDTSKAGIESGINGKAMPSFLDEASDRGDGTGAQMLLDVVLSASSGGGTKGHRGTADGGVRTIEMIGSVIMASISPPDMQPQHRSRFTMIEVVRPQAGADNTAAMNAAIERARRDGPALFARALRGFERFCAALPRFRAALGASGCVAREMDQLGTILAGYWMLAHDGVPNEAAAAAIVQDVSAFMRGADEMAVDDAPQRVLSLLLSRVVSMDRSTDQESLARVIRNAMKADLETGAMRDQAVKVLERWGMRAVRATDIHDPQRHDRFIPRLGDGNGLWLDPRVTPLRQIFENTPYAGDRWLFEVLRLPHARRSPKNVRVGAMNPTKAVWISWDAISQSDDDDPP